VFDATLPPDKHMDAVRFPFFAPGNDPEVWRDGWYPAVARMQTAATKASRVCRRRVGRRDRSSSDCPKWRKRLRCRGRSENLTGTNNMRLFVFGGEDKQQARLIALLGSRAESQPHARR
jgi:hypothetical protein